VLRRAILAMCILLFVFLAYEEWHILTYLNRPETRHDPASS
jgi:hypothetical protein